MIKRWFDLLFAGLAVILLMPLLLLVSAASLLIDGGPVLFRQQRVGRHGRTFWIHKFRTMRNSVGSAVTSDSDERITRIGRYLRATKLDELPQLFDVLIGNMSFVGPRPEVPRFVECWPRAARDVILSVRPGITDPASIAYRHESAELAQACDPEDYYVRTVLPRKVAMYVSYVESASLLRDMGILVRTFTAVLSRPESLAIPAPAVPPSQEPVSTASSSVTE